MRTIHLYGPLAEAFGPSYDLDVACPAEAVRALSVVLGRRFVEILKAGEWHVVAGETLAEGEDVGDDRLLGFGLGRRDLHICPAVAGSGGGGGIFKVVLGVALMAAAIYFAPPAVFAANGAALGGGLGATAFAGLSYGSIAMSGLIMALGGVSQMLASTPQQTSSYSNRESADDRPSFLFNGAKNTVEQGNPVPVLYGRMRVGGTVVSAGIEVEQL